MDSSNSHFLRFFNLKRSLLLFKSHTTPSSPDLDSNSVAYDSTKPGSRQPVFIAQPLRRSMTEQRLRDACNGLSIRSFSYDSALAGKAPVIGGRPQKGNGPVKLQTSRRLSSGELLITTQDHQRTLEDILEGEYIVGGADKRNSRTSQVRSPTPSLRRPLSAKGLHSRTQSSATSPVGFGHVFSNMHSSPAAGGHLSSISTPNLRSDVRTSSMHSQMNSTAEDPRIRDSLPYRNIGLAITGSMTAVEEEPHYVDRLSKDSDMQISTAQALWKAERARLAAMHSGRPYSGARHLRRQSELSTGPSESVHVDPNTDSHIRVTSSSEPHIGEVLPCEVRYSGSGDNCGLDQDQTSDYSSNQRSSLLSSEASSSSYTVGTSVVDSEPTTREDVHRIVDEMRSTYLRAIEADTKLDEYPQRQKGSKQRRPSLPIHSDYKHPFQTRAKRKAKRTSWNSIDFDGSSPDYPSRRVIGDSGFGGISREPSMYDSSPEQPRPILERADSLTLGTLVESLESSPRKTKKRPASTSIPQDWPAVI